MGVVIVDTNIIMEVLGRRRLYPQVIEQLQKYAQGNLDLAISSLTVSNTFYLAERYKFPLEEVERLVKSYKLIDVSQEDVSWALTYYEGKDFEDALQVAAAIRHNCEAFMTIDAALARKYQNFLQIDLITD